MTVGRDVERLIADWLIVEAVPRAPDRVLDGARRIIQTTTQRRPPGVFRGASATTSRLRLLAIAAVLTMLIGGVALLAFGSTLQHDVRPAPSALPPPSAQPSPSRTPIPVAALAPRVPFTSSRFGYSMTVPQGTHFTSSEPLWPGALGPGAPAKLIADYLGQSSQLFVVSWPIPPDMTPEAWLAAYESAGLASRIEPVCWPPPAQMERRTIDGRPAWLHGNVDGCDFTEVVVFVGRQVYKFEFFQHRAWAIRPEVLNPYLESIRFSS